MKPYVKPSAMTIAIRAEERLSCCDFDGACNESMYGPDTTDRNFRGPNGVSDFLTLS